MSIADKIAFWRWPRIMREQAAEIERLKAERLKTLAAQAAILEWVKITHRLDNPAEGIRALILEGRRIVPK